MVRRVRSSLVLLAVFLAAAPARAARAQQPALRMPSIDLSHAPQDIQAIWKKLQRGTTPTPAEAQRLGAWMQAHASEIQRSMTQQATQAAKSTRAAQRGQPALTGQGGGVTLRAGIGAPVLGGATSACPARVRGVSQLGDAAPSRGAALALLDSIRTQYAALETPANVSRLQHAFANAPVLALRQQGAVSLLGGLDAVTVLAYVEAARRATGADGQGAWGDLGAALVELRDPSHAVPVLRYALTVGARSPLILHNLGVAYADAGDLAAATTLLSEATTAAPRFAGAFEALAKVQSCAGNTTAAWRTLAMAQQAHWSPDREKKLDEHDGKDAKKDGGANDDDAGDDDAAEAAKPLPVPHEPSPFPPPPNAHASSFQPASPALPDSWRDAASREKSYLSQANVYSSAALAALQRGMQDRSGVQASEAVESDAAEAASHGMHVVLFLATNGKEASDAADLATARAGARATMVQRAFAEQFQRAAREETERELPLQDEFMRCKQAHANSPPGVCLQPYCRAINAFWDQSYANEAGAARVAIGGFAGIASELHRVMMAWFAWAGDPGSRVAIDAERLHWLAQLQNDAFLAAHRVAESSSAHRSHQCNDRTLADRGGSAVDAGSPNDPGPCKSTTVDWKIIKGEQSCDKYVLELKPLLVPFGGKFEYHAATEDHNGTLFMGFSAGEGPEGIPKAGPVDIVDSDMLEGHIGMGLTFDQSGLVQAAGPAVGGSLGIDVLTGHVSGTAMLNLRSEGPVGAAWGEASAPEWAAAPHFGGKM